MNRQEGAGVVGVEDVRAFRQVDALGVVDDDAGGAGSQGIRAGQPHRGRATGIDDADLTGGGPHVAGAVGIGADRDRVLRSICNPGGLRVRGGGVL